MITEDKEFIELRNDFFESSNSSEKSIYNAGALAAEFILSSNESRRTTQNICPVTGNIQKGEPMKDNVFFITAERLKEDTVINETTDNKLVNPVILMVQDIYIQSVLGTALYDEIKTQVKTNSVTGLNKKLLDNYLQITIKYYCMAEMCKPLMYRYMNNAAWTNNEQNIDPVQLEQIKNYYLNHAEWYAKRALKYLQHNYMDYPLYMEGTQIS